MLALLLLAVGANYRAAYPLPSLTVPSGWGVNIHFTHEAPGEVAKIAAAGFRWVRMDFFWEGIEKQKGVYDFSDFDALMSSLDRNHIRPVFILDYGNRLYGPGSPRTEAEREAFCRFTAAGMRHFRHRGIVWEMFNEPNIGFWKPSPNVDEYVALATAVGKTIRDVAPDEWYVGPATSLFDWGFLKRCFDSGLLSYWDAVSVHPYRQENPETAAADWTRLRTMIDAAKPAGKRIPMFSGEWGYSTAWAGETPQKQAEYAVRQYLSNLASGVCLSIYYDWKNDGTDPKDAESNFGVTLPDTSPKPAYLAIQSIASALSGFTYRRRIDTGDPARYVLLFQKGGRQKVAVWTTDPSAPELNDASSFNPDAPSSWTFSAMPAVLPVKH